MNLTLKHYHPGDVPVWKRVDGPVAGYDDRSQLWELQNNICDYQRVVVNGEAFWIVRSAFKGLVIDKASVPGERSDWYPAQRAYIWHDCDFSCHYLARFAENDDDGFRATKLLFMRTIQHEIARAVRNGVVSATRGFFWRMKGRIWYRAVNSIAGQGRYVNGSATRGNHGKFSRCDIERVM